MKLLALLTDGFGSFGGIAQYNRDLMTALSQYPRISQVVVLPRFGDANSELPTHLTQITPVAGKMAWCLQATKIALQTKFDAVFCGHLHAAPFAAGLAKSQSIPLWIQVHGIEAWTPQGVIAGWALDHARLVTAVSRHTRDRLLSWADIDPSVVRVLPNTIATNPGCPSNPSHLFKRHNLAGKKVILTVGRLAAAERYKGHDRIIAALADIRCSCPNAVYLVVGGGDDLPRLRSLAATCGVDEAVIFAGRVAADEIADYFAVADVFAMPSTGEGFGIVYLEAAAAGLPVIAGNRDGSVDALADGKIGNLIDPENYAELVNAVADGLIGGRDAGSEGVDRFAFPRFAGHVHALFEQLVR